MGDDQPEAGSLDVATMALLDPEIPADGSDERSSAAVLPSRVSIERNGEEYLVTINGATFVALSRAQAESIARRTRGRPQPQRSR